MTSLGQFQSVNQNQSESECFSTTDSFFNSIKRNSEKNEEGSRLNSLSFQEPAAEKFLELDLTWKTEEVDLSGIDLSVHRPCSDKVTQFIKTDEDNILHEIALISEKILYYIGEKTRIILEMDPYEMEEDASLLFLIDTDLGTEEAVERMGRFDDEWWLPRSNPVTFRMSVLFNYR